MKFRLDRRTVLRGLGSTAVALPFLECMANTSVLRAQPGAFAKRYALLFAGQALGGDGWAKNSYRLNGVNKTEEGHFIAPAQTGANYTLTTPLQALEDLKSEFSIVSNLRIPYSTTSTDAAQVPAGGAFRGFHGGGACPLLCGMRSQSTNFTARGITSDQAIAELNAGKTNVKSIVFRAQPSFYLSGYSFAGREYISYDKNAQRIAALDNPQTAFESLFGNFMPDNDADAAKQDFRQRSRRSVLDVISQKRKKLLTNVSAADKARLDRHFDEIRDLEMRISTVGTADGECVVPTDPGASWPIGGDNAGSGSGDIATNTGYSNEHERARIFADLIHMAFVCDITRAATLQITVFQSHMNVHTVSTDMGNPFLADLHEVGHNGDENNRGQLPVSLLLQWHLSHYAYLLDKLAKTPEGDGTLLTNSSIVFTPEAGHGKQLDDATSDNATHSVENMVMLVGGRAGGLKPGLHIDGAGKHPANVLITAMQGAGYTDDTLGEVTGTIPSLIG